MMATNSLIAHIDLLTKEVQRGVSTTNIDTLFEGSQEGLESIWRASAVQDREGNFHVVLNDDHVQKVDGAFRVRLHSPVHSGGAAVGHARYYGSEWFKKNLCQDLTILEHGESTRLLV